MTNVFMINTPIPGHLLDSLPAEILKRCLNSDDSNPNFFFAEYDDLLDLPLNGRDVQKLLDICKYDDSEFSARVAGILNEFAVEEDYLDLEECGLSLEDILQELVKLDPENLPFISAQGVSANGKIHPGSANAYAIFITADEQRGITTERWLRTQEEELAAKRSPAP